MKPWDWAKVMKLEERHLAEGRQKWGGRGVGVTTATCLPPHAAAAAAKSLQSCPTLCDPTDGSPPGSPDSGILQARTLEWVAISFSNA